MTKFQAHNFYVFLQFRIDQRGVEIPPTQNRVKETVNTTLKKQYSQYSSIKNPLRRIKHLS